MRGTCSYIPEFVLFRLCLLYTWTSTFVITFVLLVSLSTCIYGMDRVVVAGPYKEAGGFNLYSSLYFSDLISIASIEDKMDQKNVNLFRPLYENRLLNIIQISNVASYAMVKQVTSVEQ